jgi:D-alanyl-lipoteichoic acid acyltransferase DltB (MBOAT superfamily)
MFYPQLVAGPIERPQNLLEQFKIAHTFDYNRVKYGLQLMAWGLFKKIAIADRLARGVSEVYQDPAAYSGVAALTATYLFAVQIYCDFSGYSDVAIGAAEVMGFRLMRNFDRPYFSQTISEFWRRWHISLSTWFRDYLYIPLGGNRVSKSRLMVNLMLVFMLSGLWHGANWTFVIWGTLHGLYLCSAIMLTNVKSLLLRLSGLRHVPILHRTFSRLFTFHLVLLSWIFFRAANLSQAIVVLRAIVTNHTGRALSLDVMGGRTMLILCIGSLVACELMQSRIRLRAAIARSAVMIRWPVYVGSILFLLLLGDFVSKQQFIYFQF